MEILVVFAAIVVFGLPFYLSSRQVDINDQPEKYTDVD